MTTKLNIGLAAAVCMLTLSSLIPAADAQCYKNRVNRRQGRQQVRLANGRRTGELTRLENARLQRQQATLAMREARMRRTGNGMTQAEAERLERHQDNLSTNIYNQKHDNQARY